MVLNMSVWGYVQYSCTVDERGTYNRHDLTRLNVKYQLTVHDLIWVGQEYARIIHARADASSERNRLDYYPTFYATSVPLNCAHHEWVTVHLTTHTFRYRSILVQYCTVLQLYIYSCSTVQYRSMLYSTVQSELQYWVLLSLSKSKLSSLLYM